MSVDRNPAHLYPAFARKVDLILKGLTAWCVTHKPGFTAAIAEGFRTTARQEELYAQGRSKPGQVVTEKNGTTNRSNHQSGLAVDIVFAHGGELTWDASDEAWQYLGHLAREQGLTWGGDWHSLVDLPHVEWPTTDHETYEAARAWLDSKGLR